MKKRTRLFLLILSIMFFNVVNLLEASTSRLNFGSRNSALKFSPNTTFYVNSPDNIMLVDGTIVKDSQAEFLGNTISFAKGILESGDSENLMTAAYQPMVAGTADRIWLNGSCSLDAEPGTVLQKIYIQSKNNTLEGQPLLSDSISFYDANTTLSVAVQNRLSKNIELAGGQLILTDNLHLSDTIYLVGPGIVKLNNCQLGLGSYYTSAWDKDIIWDNATDIVLNGRTELTGKWTFSGECRLNGNGNVLDLSNGGTIYIQPHSKLYLTDVHIRGLGDSYDADTHQWLGKLMLGDSAAQVNSYNSDFELIGDFTTTTGKFYVEGPTTFILKDKDWTFNGSSLLTVDGVTLWLDTLDQTDWPNPGQLQAPLALYAGHYWQHDNLAYDLLYGNLDLINSGTVKEVCDRSQVFSSKSSALTSEILTTNLTLDQSVFINPQQKITVGGNITIDGQGATLVFSNPENSQFVVLPGYSVTLKNVQLDRINAKTFDLRYQHGIFGQVVRGADGLPSSEGKIIVGENVVFGLSENLTFSQGKITMLDDSANENYNTLTVRGVDGPRNLSFNPRVDFYGFASNPSPITGQLVNIDYSMLVLNMNSIALQDVHLSGIEHISFSTSGELSGSIALAGRGVVDAGDIHRFMGSGEVEYCNHVFDVSDLDNKIRLLKNNINFTGQINFALENDNSLHIDSSLVQRVASSSDRDQWWTNGATNVVFGSGLLNLTCPYGIARLTFDDHVIQVTNSASDSFKLDKNSFLGGNIIIVSKNSILNNYDGSVLTPGQPPLTEIIQLSTTPDISGKPIVTANRSLFRSSNLNESTDRFVTAFQKMQQKERDTYRPEFNTNLNNIAAQKPTLKPTSNTSRPNNNSGARQTIKPATNNTQRPGRRDIEVDELATKNVILPTNTDQVFNNPNQLVELSGATGNILLYNVIASKFSVDSTEDLNITLSQDNIVFLRTDTDVTLKSGDILNIIGANNEIHISKKFTINGKLQFDHYAQLTFVFDSVNAELVFGEDVIIDLEKGCEFTIKGGGIATLSDGCTINLKGQKNQITGVITRPPSFIITDNAELSLNPNALATIKGIGNIYVALGGLINVYKAGLQIGNVSTDDIALFVNTGGLINVIGDSSAAYGRLSLIKAKMLIDVIQDGNITVNDYGIFEINAKTDLSGNTTPEKGNLTEFIIDASSTLYVNEYGALTLANNFYGGDNIIWDSRGSKVAGSGFVEFVDVSSSVGFIGRLQTDNNNALFYSGTAGYTAEQIVRKLVNQVSALTMSTVFTDENGNSILRFANTNKMQITSGDTVIGENTSGTQVFARDSSGKTVTYLNNGTRVS
ncbi:MAG: hypothetical protein WC436_05415 [Candidatus Babeliales bacterium]